ncbi:hypothetical protein AB7C87_06335 [Natrarchaeobius sp. A-rgal3]|uniref:hypothetical protein n=1 Tax=Natrarchaeobius versutus TaxID=1679078 RepID=UPI003510540D
MPLASCGECDWQYRVDEESTRELDRAMIDHLVETGHSPIERQDTVSTTENRSVERHDTVSTTENRSVENARADSESKRDPSARASRGRSDRG